MWTHDLCLHSVHKLGRMENKRKTKILLLSEKWKIK